MGSLMAAGLVRQALPACVAAVDASSADAKRDFVRRLEALRASHVGFAEVLELERAQLQLGLYRERLTGAQLERLPASAREGADWLAALPAAPLRAVAVRLRWAAWVKALDARIAAARGPSRDAEFRSIDARVASPLDELAAMDLPAEPPDKWVTWAHRHDDLGDAFDFLILLARVDLGEPGAGDGGYEYSFELDGERRSYLLHPDVTP